MRLLIVENDAGLCALIAAELCTAGFESDCASTIDAAEDALRVCRYAALVVGLTATEGRRLSESAHGRADSIPVLMLSDRSPDDKVREPDRSAGDYLVKPLMFEELIARLQALLRRQGRFPGAILRAGNVSLDTGARQVFVGERPQDFPAKDVALLEILLRRSGLIIPKQMAEDYLFGLTDEVRSNAVGVRVHRLRKQLEDSGADIEVRTVRGIGYVLREKAAGHAPAKAAAAVMNRDALLLN